MSSTRYDKRLSKLITVYFMPIEHSEPANNNNNEYDKPSKSQIKREMHALVDLGQELINLSNNKLNQLNLDEKLIDAIALAQKINSREGKRRQIHYVGKLLRKADAQAIKQQLIIWQQGSKAETRAMHRLESLRDQLIASDEILTELLTMQPNLDVQVLRSHIREARKEMRKNNDLAPGTEPAKKHYRALFQMLKQLDFKD